MRMRWEQEAQVMFVILYASVERGVEGKKPERGEEFLPCSCCICEGPFLPFYSFLFLLISILISIITLQ